MLFSISIENVGYSASLAKKKECKECAGSVEVALTCVLCSKQLFVFQTFCLIFFAVKI